MNKSPQNMELSWFPGNTFERSDFISVHVPPNDSTHNLIDRKAIQTMKAGVRIINCARGGIVNESALLDGLNSGKIAALVLTDSKRSRLKKTILFKTRACYMHAPFGSFYSRGAGSTLLFRLQSKLEIIFGPEKYATG